MKSISLYSDNGTWLCRVHPFTKVMYAAAAISVPLILGSLWAFAAAIIADLALLASGKVLRRARALIVFSFTIIATIFIVRSLFGQEGSEIMFSIGPVNVYREGFMIALRTGLNILSMLLAFAVLVLTTNPQDLSTEMERHGFSPRFSYVISSVFNIIPQMMGTMSTISDAQRSRGMETEGSLITRMKAFIPLITPVVTSSLITTRERAMALDARGFGAKIKRTYPETREKHRGDTAATVILALIVVLSILIKAALWLS